MRVWISKTKWKLLEKRITDLENKIQSQPSFMPEKISTLDIVLDEEKIRDAVKSLRVSV